MTVRRQVERKMASHWPHQLQKHGIPDKPPGPSRLIVERQAVTQKVESDSTMFPTNRVIKRIAVIRHRRQPFEGFRKLPVLPPPAPLPLINQAELSQAVMRRGVKLTSRFRLIQCQGEQAPEVELVIGKQSCRTGHSRLRRSDATAMLIEIPIVTLMNQSAGTR